MGGKKKLSLKQLERLQSRKKETEKERKKREKAASAKEKTIGIFPPDPKDPKVINELKRMRVLTPYLVASRLNIRISAAKDLLEKLEANGTLQMVSGDHSIKIYKPSA
ncbi:hypothetical protein J7L49_01125 [Candidatus Bathyarchaeota archaeon]|nr:hypothetical protein [Candidatus Bathyarchaeota archaeon]